MELPDQHHPNAIGRRPLRFLRARRAIGGTLFAGVVVWLFAAPIVQAKPQDRVATGIVIGVVVLIVVALFLPTAFLKWYARRQRR